MLGLAGIPATAGFIGKFYLIERGGRRRLRLARRRDRGRLDDLAGVLPAAGGVPQPVIAGGSQEADEQQGGQRQWRGGRAARRRSFEVVALALLLAAATICSASAPEPLLDLARDAGAALTNLF